LGAVDRTDYSVTATQELRGQETPVVRSKRSALGIDANMVEDVILTHLHYDHVGNFDRFRKARFHLQERELAYATGRYMRYPRLSHSFEVEDICGIVRLNYASERPFTTTFHIGEMLEGCDKLLALAPDESHVVPEHDPLMMKLYPAPSPQLEGAAVRLDVPPSGAAPVRADYSGH